MNHRIDYNADYAISEPRNKYQNRLTYQNAALLGTATVRQTWSRI